MLLYFYNKILALDYINKFNYFGYYKTPHIELLFTISNLIDVLKIMVIIKIIENWNIKFIINIKNNAFINLKYSTKYKFLINLLFILNIGAPRLTNKILNFIYIYSDNLKLIHSNQISNKSKMVPINKKNHQLSFMNINMKIN
jgi:hypothetical protein